MDEKSGELFDTTMSAYNSAEICEHVGLFMLHEFQQ